MQCLLCQVATSEYLLLSFQRFTLLLARTSFSSAARSVHVGLGSQTLFENRHCFFILASWFYYSGEGHKAYKVDHLP